MEDLETPSASLSSSAGVFADAFSQAGHLGEPLREDDQAERDSVEAVARRIPRLREANEPLKLTPLRAHYLKKTLVKLEVDRELKSLSTSGESVTDPTMIHRGALNPQMMRSKTPSRF